MLNLDIGSSFAQDSYSFDYFYEISALKQIFDMNQNVNRGIRSIRLRRCTIYVGEGVLGMLPNLLQSYDYSRLVVLVDENTKQFCLPILQRFIPEHDLIELPSGERNKNLNTLSFLWEQFTMLNLDRDALILNLGGGVISDLCGFAAATFKRGIPFWNIPTSLMGMVDASIGGKTGIDFLGLKNQIGMFREPGCVIVFPGFLQTLPARELRSGYAEVIKHGLLRDYKLWTFIRDRNHLSLPDEVLISNSIWVKADLVQYDPYERKLRKALNFGHTIGHAIEAVFLEKGENEILLHGEAIAIGMICESYISQKRNLLSEHDVWEISQFLMQHYPMPIFSESDIVKMMEKITHDKKNQDKKLQFSLLDGLGGYRVNQEVSKEEILNSFEAYHQMRVSYS